MKIGIKPTEFWTLTPREFEDLYAGYVARQEEEYERAAWMVHYILAAWMKDAPKPNELLGRVRDA